MAYTQKTWEKDELIEASDLNNIEQGIKDNENDISTLEDRATEDEDNVATLENLVNANKEELDNAIEANAESADVRLKDLEQRATEHENELPLKLPKYESGSTYTGDLYTAGYVTNSLTHIYFTLPISKLDTTISSVKINSLQIRQNAKYLVGSSNGSASFEGDVTYQQDFFGTRIRLDYTEVGTLDGINNDPVGVTVNMTVTFEDPEESSEEDPDDEEEN